MRAKLWILALSVTGLCTETFAASAFRTGPIHEVQASAANVASPKLLYLAQSGGWVGAVNCATDWAYFNATDNPHLTAIVLSVQATGRLLRVYVDDALPKVGGYCQISYLALLPE